MTSAFTVNLTAWMSRNPLIEAGADREHFSPFDSQIARNDFFQHWVNSENIFQIFFKISAKRIALDRAYMTYLPRFKRVIPDLLPKVKTREDLFRDFYHLNLILEYKFCKLIIFVFFNRKSLLRKIFWQEGVVKSS